MGSADHYCLDVSRPAHVPRARFHALYSELELHRAALRAYTKPLFLARKARTRSHDGRTLYDFARHTTRNLKALHSALSRRTFHFREGLRRDVRFNGKERTIFLFPWEERIVDILLLRALNRHFHGTFSKHSYAYRFSGFGVDVCQDRIAKRLGSVAKPLYCLKRDIADYFPSVNHEILLSLLAAWVDPADYLFTLLEERVRFRFRTGKSIRVADAGIPFGTPIACFYANLYLTPLDRAMESIPELSYFRYADDILAFSSSRERAIEGSGTMDNLLGRLRLESKPTHHLNFGFLESADAFFQKRTKFRHLGLEFRADGSIGLSKDKARKIRNLFRFAFRRRRWGLGKLTDPRERAQRAVDIVRYTIENGFRSVAIIDYYLKHVTDEEQLRLLDRWLAEEVLHLSFKNGHRKGNFGKMPFSKLRQMGLPSLRHRHRLLRHGHLKSTFFVLRNERLRQKHGKYGKYGKRLPGRKAFSPGLEAVAEETS